MRKIAAALLGVALAAPVASFANYDVPDGRDCRSKNQVTVMTYGTGAKEPDRLAVCVTQNGTTLLYVGGELQSDDPRNDGFAGTCGAIIVAGVTVAKGNYGDDWDNDEFHC
ncbi:MAG: hypothetical protein HY775_00975 [Acidobacteria bacterium]|nr:hypothetical protein [Acidobacteriota bacterium]